MFKDMVGDFLTMCGFPTPIGVNCFEEEKILVEAQKIGFPVVVKPVAGHKGQGVTTGINTLEEVLYAFRKITTAAKLEGVAFEGALVQQQVYGTDHRLLSVNGKFVAALERVPAYVDGDGINTIESLIATENQKLIRLDNARSPLCKIKTDDNLNEFLKIQNLSLYAVPKAGERITLRRVANISAGGVSINVTDNIHPDNIKLVEDIASYFKVKCLGIDVLAEDISKPWTEGNFGIIEINAGPGVFMHLAPAYGGSVDVPKFIMESHFIKEGYSRIPIIAGNNLSLNFSQLLLEKVKSEKRDIFYASLTEEGVYFNGLPFHKNEDHDQNVKMILRHPKCEFAVFSHTTDDILDFGTFHSGADLVILDEATKTEEFTMLDQLLPGGLLIQIIDKKITLTQNDVELKSTDFINDADLDQKLITMVEPYLKELVSKYE
jgi:cyanophycin synthetase